MQQPSARIAALLFILFVAACDESPPAEQETPLMASIAVATGTVTDAVGGSGVSEATVRFVVANASTCSNASPPSDRIQAGQATTNARGHFSIEGEYLHVSEEKLCGGLDVQPPDDSALADTILWGRPVTFISRSRTPPVDTVRFGIELTSPPQ